MTLVWAVQVVCMSITCLWATHVCPWDVHGGYMGKGWPLGGKTHEGVYLGFAHGCGDIRGGIEGR